MENGVERQIKILHTVGSPDDEVLFKQSVLLAKSCEDYGIYQFRYALFYPDGKVSFPSTLEDATFTECKSYSLLEACQMIMDIHPDVIIHHVYGILGCTRYRALLELLGFPIIGSDAEKHYITTNKAHTRALLSSAGVSVAPGIEVYNREDGSFLEKVDAIGYPVIVKAACIEDSRGTFLVKSRNGIIDKVHQAFQLSDVVVVEKFIAGRELRCFVIEDENCDKVFLPVLEYQIDKHDIRGYDEKYTVDDAGKITQAKRARWFVDPTKESETIKRLKSLAIKAFNALQLRDFAIFDIRMDESGHAYILEANLYCSYGEKSVINYMANGAGISDRKLLETAVGNAMKRKEK